MISPGTLAASITAAAVAIADGKSSQEIALIAAVFSQLGDTLATISAQQDILQSISEDS